MDNEDITNHFEWAIMLLKHQFDKDPYSLTTDQIEVLKLHHQIDFDFYGCMAFKLLFNFHEKL